MAHFPKIAVQIEDSQGNRASTLCHAGSAGMLESASRNLIDTLEVYLQNFEGPQFAVDAILGAIKRTEETIARSKTYTYGDFWASHPYLAPKG